MKLNPESGNQNCGDLTTLPATAATDPKRFRLLKWNELVRHGDFVADVRGGFELWEGPTGFRADAFVKPIYRRARSQPAVARKSA